MYVWEQAATAGFGNGRNSIQVRVQGKEDPINVTLKDVFRIPELPCRLLSIGTIRRDGKEFVDSGTKKSYLVPLVQKGRTEDPPGRKEKYLDPVGIRTREYNCAASAHASFANKKSRLTLKEWHVILGHTDPAAIKHLEKRRLIQARDTTVAKDIRRTVCRECKSRALSYGKGGRSPKTPGEVIHANLERPFHPDVAGMKHFQVFVDEAIRDKHIRGLETRGAAVDATANYNGEKAREGVAIKCISGDRAGELGRSVKFQRMLADRGVKGRSSPPRTSQSNAIVERAIQQLMRIARSQLVQAGRKEDYCFFAVADAAFKIAGMPHEYLGGERLHESGLW